ncbi:MAG TPA: BREX system ATP-binding domain-containing protein, partial [Acidimicrobiales bacterium]|nr:BREX system ATP-binding domain-containing protein [Acidimicrobiales bacterium]
MPDHEEIDRPVLVGRGREQRVLGSLLDTVAAGTAAAVVVRGEAGLGKTALVDQAVSEARARAFTIAVATGLEFEQGLVFSGLSAVLRPLLGHLADLPEPQAHALRGALGLEESAAPVLAVYTATLSLLTLAAESNPVVVAIDDAHWIDRGSLEALVFAAHRCTADRVGFVFSQRTGVPCLLDQTGLDRLDLQGLERHDAVALLGRTGTTPSVAARCWALTHGNPLAMLEGARRLSDAQRSGTAPLPAVLPVDDRLLDDFRARLGDLRPSTLQALGVAALAADDDLGAIGRALAALGGSINDLAEAERQDVVSLGDGQVRWRHPLLRCAAHEMLDADQRRALHGALADATVDQQRGIWHLSLSVAGADAAVAERLAAAAATSYRRGALEAAAAAYEQAARLATSPTDRDRYLLGAADVRWAGADYEGAAGLLLPAIDRAGDPATRAGMAIILGQAEEWLASSHQATRRFEDHARAVRDVAPELAATLLLHATVARFMSFDVDGAVEAAAAAREAAAEGNAPEVLFGAYAMAALAAFYAGGGPAAEVALEPIAQVALA